MCRRGALYVLAHCIMAVMVLNCWGGHRTAWFIYFLKWCELFGINMNSTGGLLIQYNILRVVLVRTTIMYNHNV
jgi:hypothetical protein